MNAKAILLHASKTQLQAESMKRYSTNPYVHGDTTAEHISRGLRLISLISQDLRQEFPFEPRLIEDVYATFCVHDEDELLQGFDYDAYENQKDPVSPEDKIEQVKKSFTALSNKSRSYLQNLYEHYKHADSRAGRIATQIDRITGNQVVIEQRVGLVAPLIATFNILYVQKVRDLSGSHIMKELVDTQIEQIHETRETILSSHQELQFVVSHILQMEGCPWDERRAEKRVQELLKARIDENLCLKGKKVNMRLWEY